MLSQPSLEKAPHPILHYQWRGQLPQMLELSCPWVQSCHQCRLDRLHLLLCGSCIALWPCFLVLMASLNVKLWPSNRKAISFLVKNDMEKHLRNSQISGFFFFFFLRGVGGDLFISDIFCIQSNWSFHGK